MKKNGKDNIVDRRDFMKKAGTATVVAGAVSTMPRLIKKAHAAKRDFFLIGHPNPSTGPIADFGAASPWADDKAIAAINKKGGVYIEEYGKSVPVKLKLVDTESDPTKAAELTARLIIRDKVDLMVTMHTPDTVNPVDAMCDKNKMPCISLDAPVEPWLTGGPYHWSFHAFWTVDTMADVFIGMWSQFAEKTSKVVGVLWPNDPDGTTFAKIFPPKFEAAGYKLIDPGRFPYFQKDWTTFINLFKKEKVEIVSGCPIPPDWATAWRQFHQQGFVPKIATIAKACLFPSSVEALGGNLAEGITTEIWWSDKHPFKSSLTGASSKDLCDAWEKETGNQWTAPIGYKYAAFEIAYDALMRAKSVDRNKIREAIAATDMKTIVGPIKYNDQNYCETPLVGGQWVKGKKWPWELEITYNALAPEIPTTSEMKFPLPKA